MDSSQITARPYGRTFIDVRNGLGTSGARGDGTGDDTDAFYRAFGALPSADGGMVYVPPGDYMIDSTRSVCPTSRSRLYLAVGARLHARANTAPKDRIVLCQDIVDFTIDGDGELIGDLSTFKPQAGTTSEWGHCMAIFACQRGTVAGIGLSGAVGDGCSIGGKTPTTDLLIANVRAKGNRRQGLSIVSARNLRVVDSSFATTAGTSPQCGIDIEPEAGQLADNIVLLRVSTPGNKGYGINSLQRTDGGPITNVVIQDCDIGNGLSNGLVLDGGTGYAVMGGHIHHNSATGLRIQSRTRNVRVSGVNFETNGTRYTARKPRSFVRTGIKGTPAIDRDIIVQSAGPGIDPGIDIQTNTYTGS